MAHKWHHSLNGINSFKNKNGELLQTRRHSLNGNAKRSHKSDVKRSNGNKSKHEEIEHLRNPRQGLLKVQAYNGERSRTKQNSKLMFYPLSDDVTEGEHFDKSEIESLYEESGLSDYQTLSEFHEHSLRMLENVSNLRHVVKSSGHKGGADKHDKAIRTDLKIDKNRVRSIVDTERRNSEKNGVETEDFSDSERYELCDKLHSNSIKVGASSSGYKSEGLSGEHEDSNKSFAKQSKSYFTESDRKESNNLPSKSGMEYWVPSRDQGQRSRSYEGQHRIVESSRSENSRGQKTNNLYVEERYSREKSVKSDMKQELNRDESKNVDYGKLDIMFKHIHNDQFKMIMVSEELSDKTELSRSNRDANGEDLRHTNSEQVLSATETRITFLEKKEQASLFVLYGCDALTWFQVQI